MTEVLIAPYATVRITSLVWIKDYVYKYPMNSKQFKKWLEQQGARFEPAKGGHLKVFLKDRQSVLPMHSGELKTGLVEGIKKQLGLK